MQNTAILPSSTDEFTFARLKPHDEVALARHFGLPAPAATPLAESAAAASLTPEIMWRRLENTMDVRLMIAAYLLRKPAQRGPVSAVFSPRPHTAAPVRTPRSPTEASRRAPAPAAPRPKISASSPGRIVASVLPNPKKPGSESYARFALYKPGMTEADLLSAGMRKADFAWDTERGFVTWADPESAPAETAPVADGTATGPSEESPVLGSGDGTEGQQEILP